MNEGRQDVSIESNIIDIVGSLRFISRSYYSASLAGKRRSLLEIKHFITLLSSHRGRTDVSVYDFEWKIIKAESAI